MHNEYPQFGGVFEVIHHTEYLARLVKEGRLKPEGEIAAKVTYHDPCYNARHNDVWKGAREVIEAPRRRIRRTEKARPRNLLLRRRRRPHVDGRTHGQEMNMERTDEALASASDTLAVGCPFCNIMLSDGITERHSDEKIVFKDVAQLLQQSIEFHPDSELVKANGNGHPTGPDEYQNTQPAEETTGPGDPQTWGSP